MSSPRRTCTEITPQCPVEATTYGYYPVLSGNIILLAVFAICFIIQLILGILYKLRAFTAVLCTGCALEALGYGGRIIMHGNPWSSNGFKLQIVAIVLAPPFLAAGVYLTLKHLVLYLGPENSRIRPKLYTWIFVSCDFVSIAIQAVGGGVAATEDVDLMPIGNNLIVAGIAFQVATMFVCGLLAADFALKIYKGCRAGDAEKQTELDRLADRKFRFYLGSSATAFTTIFIRCVYRIPEMCGGWGSPLMRREPEFLVLDGAMMAIAAILMSAAHPGIFFPAIGSSYHFSTPAEEAFLQDENTIIPKD